MDNQNQQQQIQIKMSDDVLKGSYSNQAIIRNTKDEVIIDFFNYFPGDPNAIVNNRVILSPAHFKGLIVALQDHLKKYESQFEPIKSAAPPEHKFGFDTNKAQ